MNKTPIMQDPVLLKKARSIFGNIVMKAYVVTWNFGNGTKSEIHDRLVFDLYKKSDRSVGIDVGARQVLLVFENGKSVEIETSEWGHITPAPTKGVYEVERN